MTGRAWALAYVILAAAIEIAGGKAYYLAGMLPLFVAAGAQPTVDWAVRGRRRLRQVAVGAAFLLSLPNIYFALPLVPVAQLHASAELAANSTLGESVGWPTYVQEIAAVYHALPASQQRSAIVLASNYGEAGAVNHFGQQDGLPAVYSGHMSFWYWGPPPPSATTAVAVGFARSQLTPFCASLHLAGHLRNYVGVQDEEEGMPIWVCSTITQPWTEIWPQLRNFG